MLRSGFTFQTVGRIAAVTAAALILSACIPIIPEFSPDGRTLAFSLDGSLVLIDIQTKTVRVLPDSQGGWWPLWSPDGRYIAFITITGEQSVPMKLYDLAAGRARVLADNSRPLAWREDSRRLAVYRVASDGRKEIGEVVALTPEGTITLVARLPAEDAPGPSVNNVASAVWVPHTEILGLLADDRDGRNVYLTEAGEVQRVTKTGDVIGLGRSNTGRRLIVARSPREGTGPITLHAYDLPGRAWTRLPLLIQPAALGLDPRFRRSVREAVFSPDGARLALTARFNNPEYDLMTGSSPAYSAWSTLNVTTGDLQRVWRTEEISEGFSVSAASWSRDGQLAIADTYYRESRLYSSSTTSYDLLRIVLTLLDPIGSSARTIVDRHYK